MVKQNPSLSDLPWKMVSLLKPRFIGGFIRFKHFEKVVRRLKFTSVLDAGCGGGAYSFFIACKFKTVRVVGYDINIVQIRRNNVKAKEENLTNVEFFHKDLTSLDDLEKFDLIVCVDVLEHIKDDEKCIRLFYRALKPGGYIYVHVPGLQQFRHFEKSKYLEPERTHIREGYSIEQMNELLTKNHFNIIQVGRTFGTYGILAWEIYMLNRQRSILLYLLNPLLLFLSWLDLRSKNEGHSNFYVLAKKG